MKRVSHAGKRDFPPACAEVSLREDKKTGRIPKDRPVKKEEAMRTSGTRRHQYRTRTEAGYIRQRS